MHDTTVLRRPEGSTVNDPRYVTLQRRFPTVHYLRRGARRNLPRFAFEYSDGGAGVDGGIARNWNALDAVELVPRYGVTTALPPVDVEIFGHRYAAPLGVAPMGGPSLVFPGADQYLAAACQRANVPYTLGQVLTEWGVALSATQVGGLHADATHVLAAFVNGKRFTGDPATLQLKRHLEIALWYGPSDQTPKVPSSYKFPAGL